MDFYDRTTDPKHHLSNFKSQMYLADASDVTRCKAFPTTLTKAAMKWFDSPPPRSVTSFDDLSQKFFMRFSIHKDKVKHTLSLLGVKLEVGEPLKGLHGKIQQGVLGDPRPAHRGSNYGPSKWTQRRSLFHSISKRHPTSLSDVQERVKKYINMEENVRLREPNWRPGHSNSSKEKEREPKKKEEVGLERPRRYHSYTPLRVSLVDVYRKICHTKRLPPPRPIKNKKRGNRGDYCEYHKIYGHPMNDCYDLKNVIEKQAREGQLDRYLMKRSNHHEKKK
ncbi:uncharacterized protein LOC130963190 [Arachis stenosperma]|uniref:uncharacterized protein LOC130963190 n=1 Tax=Arachis stenosperma TaxID=217475 RepID=UPI0025AC90BF|nr:uncharacterized protein LOC130963190 [Arachis stenosperma]